jgi:hypothetical protein
MKKNISKIFAVDLNLLKNYSPPGMFMHIDPGIEEKLVRLPEVQERVKGCVRFCWHIAYQPPDTDINADNDAKKRQKYLRAALAEYASLDEVAEYDFENMHLGGPPRIINSKDPRLHIMRLLRHANVHLETSQLQKGSRPAIWNGPNGPVHFDFTTFVINNLEQSIGKTRDAQKYQLFDLQEMIKWLKSEQYEWGIQNVILRATESYIRELLRAAGL